MSGLVQMGDFTLHGGGRSRWLIDCDALTDDDLAALADVAARVLPPFSAVEGVPRGGLRFAEALRAHVYPPSGALLIADDVWTTGASMERQRAGRHAAYGVVLFARGVPPWWVSALFHCKQEMWGG